MRGVPLLLVTLYVALVGSGCLDASAGGIPAGCIAHPSSRAFGPHTAKLAAFGCDKLAADGRSVQNLTGCVDGPYPPFLSGSGTVEHGKAAFTIVDGTGASVVALTVTPGAEKSFDQALPFHASYLFTSVLSGGFVGNFTATLRCYQ